MIDCEILKKSYIFNDFTDDELGLFTQIAYLEEFGRGDAVFNEGDPGEGLYLIEQGMIKISKVLDSETGLHKNLAVLSDGESFGEMALLDGGQRSATATAVADSKLWVIPSRPFRKLLDNHPGVASKFYNSNLMVLCGRLRSTNEMLSDILTKNTLSRTELDRVRGEFLKVVSQELETPVSSLKNFSEMLTDFDSLDEELRRDFVSIVVSQIEVLAKLVEQILALFEVSFGEFKLAISDLELDPTFEELVRRYSGVCEDKQLTIDYQRSSGAGTIQADPKLLLALDQILFNAVKHSDPGAVVEIRLEDRDGGLAMELKSPGKGIPAEQMAILFDDLTVAADQESDNVLGIGLPLANGLIKAHNGRLTVENKAGQGCIFTIWWPEA